MNRRAFIQKATFLGAASSIIGRPEVWAMTEPMMNGSHRSPLKRESEQSSDQDPMAIHRSTLVVDGLDPYVLDEEYPKLLKMGGVNCWSKSMSDIHSFASAYNFLDSHSDKIVPATTVKGIRQVHNQGKIALIFSWQAANPLVCESGYSSKTTLRAYYQLGLRSCGIAYNFANIFGGGCMEPNAILTRAGRRLVEEIHKLRIILDVGGHTAERTSLDAIEMSSGVPVICSHTNVQTLNDNPRCVSDRIIEAIAKTGGVIGLTALSDLHVRSRDDVHIRVTPQAGLEKHLDQYDYIRKLVGADHIGLGPDFSRVPPGKPSPNRDRMPAECYSDTPGFWYWIKGFEKISELPNMTQGLIDRGWSVEEIRKVLGENWLRVYEQVWGA